MVSQHRSMALAAAALGLAVTLAASANAGSLIAHWKLDDGTGSTTAADSAGSNTGTLTNMDPNTDWVAGKIGTGALDFDGEGDFVDCGNGASLLIQGDMTLAIWIKPDTIAGERGLASKWGNSWCWVIGHDGLDLGKNAIYFNGWKVANTAVTVGVWSHLAVVYSDSADTITFYLNGAPDGTVAQTANQGTGANLTIGQRGGNGGWFDGLIDDVRVYDYALSESEIQALAAVTVTATDAEASEQGPDTGTFRIFGTAPLTVMVGLTGSAVAADYTTSPDVSGGSVLIEAGQEYVDVTVTPVADTSYFEDPETVVVTILASGDYIVGSQDSATVTITDHTPPVPGDFVLTSPVNGEQNAGRTPMLTWRRSSDADDYTGAIYPNDSMTAGTEVHSDTVATPATSYAVPSTAGLAYDTEYWWKVTAHNDVMDTPASNAPFSFHTTAPGNPSVRSTSPSDGASDVPVSTNIRITFSEPMQKAATEGAFTLVDADSLDVPGNASLTANGMTLIFTPDPELLEEATYTATLTTAAIGLDGNALDAEEEIVFTTEPPLTGFGTGDGCLAGAGSGVALWALLSLAAAVRRRRA